MDELSTQHVQIPNMNLKEQGLTLNDPYIYACIKRHMNNETKQAYPQIKTLAKESGLYRETIQNAIKRLEDAGYISVQKRSGTSSIYTFNEYQKFEIFSFDFLDNKELSPKDKSMIVMSQQFMYKNPQTQTGIITFNSKKLADLMNLDYRTFQRYEKSLEEKHILVKLPDEGHTDIEVNSRRIYDFSKFANVIALKFLETDNKLDNLTKEQGNLQFRLEEMRRQQEQDTETIKALLEKVRELELQNESKYPDVLV